MESEWRGEGEGLFGAIRLGESKMLDGESCLGVDGVEGG